MLNTTTNNQSTHCPLPFGPAPNTLVNIGSTALIELFCGPMIGKNTNNLTIVRTAISDALDLSNYDFSQAVTFRWVGCLLAATSEP